MKRTTCPYCGKTMNDYDDDIRYRCPFCGEYLIDIDKDHCRPDKRREVPKNVSIEFTPDELALITAYKDEVSATTLKNAILNAISVALDAEEMR